jgi:hypothetical protein
MSITNRNSSIRIQRENLASLQRRRPTIEKLETRVVLSANSIATENLLPGNPPSQWDIVGVGDTSIQGFATNMSVDQGEPIAFKIDNQSLAPYRLEIYRIGYYGGNGARLVDTIASSQTLVQSQPLPLTNPATGLVDAGNWSVSATWNVPVNATSGVYIAKATREDTGGSSHIIFVVRDDDGNSDLLYQTADTTWQAYNRWGGNSLYVGSPANRAYAVSYNRPFDTRAVTPKDAFFSNEYAMVRWLERNGYDVSYSTGVDSDLRGEEILEHDVFVSVGHDEYWSANQRANVTAARDAGVNLAFFSGNEVYWKTRWENSIDSSGTSHRTLLAYKETWANAKIDPTSTWTGTWRDDRFSPPSDGGQPENALTGQLFTVNRGPGGNTGTPITVGSEFSDLRFWRNTRVAALQPGQSTNVGDYVLGYEWDEDLDNGFRPKGTFQLSSTTQSVPQKIDQYGGPNTIAGIATHNLTMYRATSGALVFGAGTINWSWGLDGEHDVIPSNPDPAIQQATVNIFADMGVQATTLQSGLVQTSTSTDLVAPTSSILSISNGATVPGAVPFTLSGTSSDGGGGVVSGVEVSVDNGVTWRRANGRSNWTYTWAPTNVGPATILSRAVDDSANVGPASAAINVVVSPTSSTSLWNTLAVPTVASVADTLPVELGVRFQASTNGYVTGIRFYKGAANLGPHTGRLWTSTGVPLASVTFTGETGIGWQQADFSAPVGITAGTNYVASYFAPNGGYSFDGNYFATNRVNGPLTAPANGNGGSNGLYRYASSGGFPTNSYNSANYWVDVVFENATSDTTLPSVVSQSPPANAVNLASSTRVTARFDESVQPNSISMVLRDPGQNVVPASIAYDSQTFTVTLTPGALLSANVTYAVTLSGAMDLAGNVMSTINWSFTVGGPISNASLWSPSTTPSVQAANDSSAVELGVKFRSDRNGFITGLRFHKGSTNTGTHIGNLWSASGSLLASATFTSESASGWQTVQFSSPVAITAKTTYIASYFAPNGHYSFDAGYFGTSLVNGPLRALQNGEEGGNGLYRYTSASAVPNQTYNAANYWVDVLFSDLISETIPPSLTNRSPSPSATVAGNTNVTATFSEPVQAASIAFELRDSLNAAVAAVVTYDANTRTVLLDPVANLVSGGTYTAILSGATDLAGNQMAAVTWTFDVQGVWTQSTQADFNAGTHNGTVASSSGDGALQLATTFADDFAGTSLSPAAWAVSAWSAGNAVGIQQGVLSIQGSQVISQASYVDQTVEGLIRFGASPYQHFGLATALNAAAGNYWAIFSTGASNNTLFARVNLAGVTQETNLGQLPTGFHTYQVRPTATGFSFYVDGSLLTSIAASLPVATPLKIVFSSYLGAPSTGLQVDSVRVVNASPQIFSNGLWTGVFQSTSFDAGQTVQLQSVNWIAESSAGTGLTVEIMISNQANFSGATWSQVSSGQNLSSLGLSGRYLKYRLTLTTNNALLSPKLNEISLTWL